MVNKTQKSPILITGGCGYIGSHLAIELLSKNYSVVIIDNLSNSKKSIIKTITRITKKIPIFYKVDLRNTKKLEKVFCKHNFSAVFHLAGLKSIEDSVSLPLLYYNENISATLSLLDVLNKYKVKNLIFSSTATVYNKNMKLPWTENSLTAFPDHAYGSSKLIIENLLRDFQGQKKNISVGILRYFNPGGNHSSGIIGEDPKKRAANLLPAIIKYLEGKEKNINIFGNQYQTKDGFAIRDFIHIEDLVKGHVLALEYIKNKNIYDIWNLGSGKGNSVIEIIHAFEKIIEKKIKIKILPPRKGDLGKFWAGINKAKKELKWTPNKNIHDIANDILKHINKKKSLIHK